MKQQRFVALDRDGTIIVECHYLSDPIQVELLPGAADGLRKLSAMGLGLVVITNQSGLGRGFFDQARLDQIHQRMRELLEKGGVTLDGIYFCPHTPEDHCSCRKPKPGLLELAAKEIGFEPKNCFVIGDKPCDIELGQGVGATTLLVCTGYGAQGVAEMATQPEYIVDDLSDAAHVIQRVLRQERGESNGTGEKI